MSCPVRYQNCRWYVRLWRRRHYLVIPYEAVRLWGNDEVGSHPFSFYWGWAIGEADVRMEWTYSLDEVDRELTKRRKKRGK